MRKEQGLTLIELLVVISILLIILGITIISFRSFQGEEVLSDSTEKIINILRLAQSRTLASEDATQYGVYFDKISNPNQYTLFKYANYNYNDLARDASCDEVYQIPNSVEIDEINLGAGQEVVFSRLTGETANSGTVSLWLKNDNSKTRTVGIETSGKITLGVEIIPPYNLDDDRIKDSRHVYFNYSRFINTATEVITLTFTYSSPTETKDIPVLIASNMNAAGQIDWEEEVLINGQNQKIKIHTIYLNNPDLDGPDPFDTLFSIYRDMRLNTEALNISISGDSFGNLLEYSADGRTINHPSSFVNNFQW